MDGLNWSGLAFLALVTVLVAGLFLWAWFDHERDSEVEAEARSISEHRRAMRAIRPRNPR